MNTLFTTLLSAMEDGQDTVLVSVVASSGSTPRGAGAHMLVGAQGHLCGTIGGGAVEYRALEMAADVLCQKSSCLQDFILRKNDIQDLGMICGGDVSVFFRYMPHDNAEIDAAARAALDLFDTGEESWLIFDVTPGESGGISLFDTRRGLVGKAIPQTVVDALNHKPGIVEDGGRRYYTETLVRAGRVYIFGGGHVAQALVPVLTAVQFRCVVLEDRESFCEPSLFPGIEETRLIDLEHIGDTLQVTADDYICIMTRGHKDDMTAQAFAMRSPARYIGVIGSRRKIVGVTEKLKADYGFANEDFARITTPIGLDIGAETPAEIAVSIAAQLIAVRAGK